MSKQRGIKILRAWIGYTDGKPYVFVNDHGQKEWCTFTNRADARKAFADVRRCDVVVRTPSNTGEKA